MCWTMQPMTSPTGGSPIPVTEAIPGTSSSDVRTPSAWNRAMRAAATGASPLPSHSVMARTVVALPARRGRTVERSDRGAGYVVHNVIAGHDHLVRGRRGRLRDSEERRGVD